MYEPCSAVETVLHAVVRAHLEQFLATTASATDGAGVPRFMEREFRDFLGCGDLRRGLLPLVLLLYAIEFARD